MAEIISPVETEKKKMTYNDKRKFEGMCLKLRGYSKETEDKVKCELPVATLEVDKDFGSARVDAPSRNRDSFARGYVEDVKKVGMSMVHGKDNLKILKVKGEDGSVSISSFV